MPSFNHEALLQLLCNAAGSAATLLRELEIQLPEYDEVHTDSSNLSDLQPAEYRADLVLFLQRGTQKVLGVIVEIQLGRDEDKPYAWPAYVANLRARHRCPVCLLVITVERAVERWAGKAIELGPGSRCLPYVLGPSNVQPVTDLHAAKANVELAVLSAIEHGRDSNITLVSKVASAAILASAGLDARRANLYLDLLLNYLSEDAQRAASKNMNLFGYDYQSDFARRYVAEGRMSIILKQLATRFGPLPEAANIRIRAATESHIDALAERVLTVQTLEEALSPLTPEPPAQSP